MRTATQLRALAARADYIVKAVDELGAINHRRWGTVYRLEAKACRAALGVAAKFESGRANKAMKALDVVARAGGAIVVDGASVQIIAVTRDIHRDVVDVILSAREEICSLMSEDCVSVDIGVQDIRP